MSQDGEHRTIWAANPATVDIVNANKSELKLGSKHKENPRKICAKRTKNLTLATQINADL